MEQISRIGMDTSKHIFQVHGVNTAEQPGSAEEAAIPVPRKKYVEARGQVLDHTAQRSPSQACGWTTVDRAEAARKRKHRPPTKSNPRILPLKICHCGVRRQTRLIILIDLKLLKVTMPTTTPTILNQINAEKTKVSECLHASVPTAQRLPLS